MYVHIKPFVLELCMKCEFQIVLCASSPYFEKMFSDGFDENENFRVVIKDIEPKSMKIILDFVYTGGKEINIEEDNVQSLLHASNLLQFSDIKLLCVEFLLKHLETSNCLQLLELAELYDCQDMKTIRLLKISLENILLKLQKQTLQLQKKQC